MPVVVAETTRGGITESLHHGVVVAVDAAGEIVATSGDPEHVVFFRSSAKPFQAIPVIESGAADAFGITPAELALCCASHAGSPGWNSIQAPPTSTLGHPDGPGAAERKPSDPYSDAAACGSAERSATWSRS